MKTYAPFAVVLLAVSGARAAEPAAPPPPTEFDVVIRYRIDAPPVQRVPQYEAMMKYLASVGFKRTSPASDTEPEDAAATELAGTIAGTSARKLLGERHVKTVLLVPHGAKLPPEPTQLVRVSLELTRTANPSQQRVLDEQVRAVLKSISFQEAIGYDNRGHTRLAGNVPAGRLLNLLQDLRQLPEGAKKPGPFQGVNPLRLIEVQPGWQLAKVPPEPSPVPAGQEKLSAELRALLADKAAAAKPQRLEVILATAPAAEDNSWVRPLLRAVPGLLIEGRLGALVSVVAQPDQARALAAEPIVNGIRLPAAAHQDRASGKAPPGDAGQALQDSGLERLHELGHRGKGIRIAVLDSDFHGYPTLIRDGKLPATTRLLDLTAECNPDLTPEPPGGNAADVGHGARMALAAALAAPEAELVLVRVNPALPFQVEQVAKAINGDPFRAECLDERAAELKDDADRLEARAEVLQTERRALLSANLPIDEFQPKWEAYKKRQEAHDRDDKAYRDRLRRYLALWEALRGLKGVRVVCSGLVWNSGHPADGGSPLSRYFDDRPFRGALWFQAAGDTRGQAWTGHFRDADSNGAMEFTAPGAPLPPGRWSPELNFLAWQPAGGAPTADLPAGTKLHLALQWREAHDPIYLQKGEDAYREPIANLRLLLVRQRDPAGKALPADDFEVVAQSDRLPLRLNNSPASATYEHVLDYTVSAAGRYAVMVLGRAPTSIQPGNRQVLPGAQRVGELRPRLFVETLAGPGRAVLADFTSDRGAGMQGGSLGVPAESHAVITVGVAGDRGRPEPFSAGGPPWGMDLLTKPDVLAFDRLAGDTRGTGVAAGFAAGLAASAMSAGAPSSTFLEALRVTPGGVLRLPHDWPSPQK